MTDNIIDPLELLRDYIMAGQGVSEEQNGKKITFEEEGKMLAFSQFEGIGPGAVLRLPLSTPTAWKRSAGSNTEFYSLGSLWFSMFCKS
mmetsp:Transcript_8464/g.12926  ORF Transcript_8464/g.12926 Transcript_8464/m.12926 type:complete len:89 (-) Transcript_8464:1214-1480(-)